MRYDVAILGGGITGAGLLRDCAQRGLRALLLERGALGRATTAASSHLLHGGLRYLLYDRLTTHATAWDAGHILRLAPERFTRLPILWPVYAGQKHSLATVETLLESYDFFQRMKGGRPHLRLRPEHVLRLVPGLRAEGLKGALSFDEWWVDAPALAEAVARSAQGLGAELRTGHHVLALRRLGGALTGVETAGPDGKQTLWEAAVTINATGPWADRVAGLAGLSIPMRLRKGSHLVYGRPLLPVGLLLEAADKERVFFVLPGPAETLVGPTDLPYAGDPDRLETSPEELRYLLDSARRYLPDFPERFDSTRCGARPILGQSGGEKTLSREYEVYDHAGEGVEGFLTLAGGKLSDFRLMAQDATDLACRKLGRAAPCRTHLENLAGRPLAPADAYPPPPPALRRALRRSPRLREAYALAHLGGGLLRHWTRALGARLPYASAEAFKRHYAD